MLQKQIQFIKIANSIFMIRKAYFSILLFLFVVLLAKGCSISGREIGYCSANPLKISNFCGRSVGSYICLPAFNQTWSQYDVFYKDAQIQSLILTNLQKQLINEYLNSRPLQISNNPSCYEAYKDFSCKWNFPSCNPTTKQSVKMCQSICDNFQTACGGTTDVCQIIYAKTDLGLDSSC